MLINNAAFRNATGPRRLCPGCNRMVSTDHGRFVVHYIGSKQACSGSDQLVPRRAPDPQPSPQTDVS